MMFDPNQNDQSFFLSAPISGITFPFCSLDFKAYPPPVKGSSVELRQTVLSVVLSLAPAFNTPRIATLI